MSEQVQGPLAGQAARSWSGDDSDIGDYAGEPATEGHLPASDAVSPSDTYRGSTVRDEIQQMVDIEMSGESLSAEQKAVRTHGEAHVIDMEVHPDSEKGSS